MSKKEPLPIAESQPTTLPPAPPSPPAPTRPIVDSTHTHFDLWKRVQEALSALPSYFSTETNISGLRATDIFTLNSTLGATIEDQVVTTLNRMRDVWDPNDKYLLYSFIRQPQTFPDVLFAKRRANNSGVEDIIFGIELKGWYVLAKEGEPSFRYQVTPAVCADLDLVCIVPWYLSNVISGTPKVLSPYIESAKYAAEYRNYHWKYIRDTKANTDIIHPSHVTPYPSKSDIIGDKPVSDGGNNFGRFARTKIMDDYKARIGDEPISGISVKYWRDFFKMFQEDDDATKIASSLLAMQQRLKDTVPSSVSELGTEIIQILHKEFGIE